jgi:hypothetical protein
MSEEEGGWIERGQLSKRAWWCAMSVWSDDTNINKVLKAIKELTIDGRQTVDEPTLISKLAKDGTRLSPLDLSKILLTLELLGYINVQLSTKEEKLIKLLKTT